MKKILIICLVLALATAVSAMGTIEVTVNGDPWWAQFFHLGDVVKVAVVEDSFSIAPWSALPIFSCTVSCGDYVEDSLFVVHPTLPGVPWTAQDQGDGFVVSGSGSYLFTPTPANGIVMSFEFIFTGNTDTTFTGLYGTQEAAGWDFTIIPEPMTILMLGLGGLFLRRRK